MDAREKKLVEDALALVNDAARRVVGYAALRTESNDLEEASQLLNTALGRRFGGA